MLLYMDLIILLLFAAGMMLLFQFSHITFSNISVINCPVVIKSFKNITITSSFFVTDQLNTRYTITAVNDFDVTVSSSVFAAYDLGITYIPLAVCSNELLHYSLILTNVTFTGSQLDLNILHGSSYNVSIIFDHVDFSNISLNYFWVIAFFLFPSSSHYFMMLKELV